MRSILRLPQLQRDDWRVIVLGGVWLVTAFGLTMFLPVRSSLYVCLPSVGGALAAAAIVARVWNTVDTGRQRQLAVASLILPVALLPIHWLRNDRWTALGEVSTSLLYEFSELARATPEPCSRRGTS